MCGGISTALSLTTKTGEGFYRRLVSSTLLYNVGRVLSYITIGCLAGALGALLTSIWMEFLVVLRTLAAIMLILAGIYLMGVWNGLIFLERAGTRIWRKISPLADRFKGSQSPINTLILGMIWGWLPCGLVYSALTYAATQADILQSGLIMLFFGLGTLPSMVTTGLLAKSVQGIQNKRYVYLTSGVLLIVFGLASLPLKKLGISM
ncbi:MAG: cytochrome biogenesis protein [Gammaproteobacteria bacterium]|nr:MAG: cytochrome biogenesis protein [Gammaproteobacteria bacterium]